MANLNSQRSLKSIFSDRLTTASSLTAARERFRMSVNGHSWATAAEAEALGAVR